MEHLPPPFPAIFAALLLGSLGLVLWRLIRGPHILDRVLCIDTITMIVVSLICIWELVVGAPSFFDAVLVLAIVGFIGTVSLAKYLERGGLIE